jgi:hypothetical protein
MSKKLIISLLLFISLASAKAEQPLKVGRFTCVDDRNEQVVLQVQQHPTKPSKILINFNGRDHVLHFEKSVSGALRYEGAISRIVYIQTPKLSFLLDDNLMRPILTDCPQDK